MDPSVQPRVLGVAQQDRREPATTEADDRDRRVVDLDARVGEVVPVAEQTPRPVP